MLNSQQAFASRHRQIHRFRFRSDYESPINHISWRPGVVVARAVCHLAEFVFKKYLKTRIKTATNLIATKQARGRDSATSEDNLIKTNCRQFTENELIPVFSFARRQ